MGDRSIFTRQCDIAGPFFITQEAKTILEWGHIYAFKAEDLNNQERKFLSLHGTCDLRTIFTAVQVRFKVEVLDRKMDFMGDDNC